LLSCRNDNQSLITAELIEGVGGDTAAFVREIPVSTDDPRKDKYEFMYNMTTAYAHGLKLDSLFNGYKSIEVRIWLGHSMAREKQVVILTNRVGDWKGRVLCYAGNCYCIKSDKYINPSHGWGSLLEKLQKLQITTLPNSDDLAGYPRCCGADGIDYIFEIATEKKYRFYHYSNPEEYTAKFWQAKNVLEFASLLEEEFAFKYTR
jgi:hypothetical protein